MISRQPWEVSAARALFSSFRGGLSPGEREGPTSGHAGSDHTGSNGAPSHCSASRAAVPSPAIQGATVSVIGQFSGVGAGRKLGDHTSRGLTLTGHGIGEGTFKAADAKENKKTNW